MVRSSVRAPMPPSRRAKQFAPFDALKGLKEALAAKEKVPAPRRYLTEDGIAEINQHLSELRKNQLVTVIYYCSYQEEYVQITGKVVKVDIYWKILQIGEIGIDFFEILDIES